jgi:hypothetical protein
VSSTDTGRATDSRSYTALALTISGREPEGAWNQKPRGSGTSAVGSRYQNAGEDMPD